MNPKLKAKILESLSAVLPITGIVCLIYLGWKCAVFENFAADE